MVTRRKFLTDCRMIAVGAGLADISSGLPDFRSIEKKTGKSYGMILRFKPYELQLKHVFTLASGSRTTTPVMLTEIEFDNVVGYGEASMPPYLGETHESVQAFLSKVDLSKYENPFDLETILNDIDSLAPHNPAAKASVDIALHDLVGKSHTRDVAAHPSRHLD